jgi:hypothetical protein
LDVIKCKECLDYSCIMAEFIVQLDHVGYVVARVALAPCFLQCLSLFLFIITPVLHVRSSAIAGTV